MERGSSRDPGRWHPQAWPSGPRAEGHGGDDRQEADQQEADGFGGEGHSVEGFGGGCNTCIVLRWSLLAIVLALLAVHMLT